MRNQFEVDRVHYRPFSMSIANAVQMCPNVSKRCLNVCLNVQRFPEGVQRCPNSFQYKSRRAQVSQRVQTCPIVSLSPLSPYTALPIFGNLFSIYPLSGFYVKVQCAFHHWNAQHSYSMGHDHEYRSLKGSNRVSRNRLISLAITNMRLPSAAN